MQWTILPIRNPVIHRFEAKELGYGPPVPDCFGMKGRYWHDIVTEVVLVIQEMVHIPWKISPRTTWCLQISLFCVHVNTHTSTSLDNNNMQDCTALFTFKKLHTLKFDIHMNMNAANILSTADIPGCLCGMSKGSNKNDKQQFKTMTGMALKNLSLPGCAFMHILLIQYPVRIPYNSMNRPPVPSSNNIS